MTVREQYGRTWQLRAGTLDISALDITYDVKKTAKSEPNTAQIQVFGLSEKSRTLLSASKSINVSLAVGYQGRNSVIYLGQTRGGVTRKEQPEMITTLETGDSEKNHRASEVKAAVGPSLPIGQALSLIARSLGVKLGNVQQAAAKIQAKGVALFPVETAFTGFSAQALTDFCSAAGLEWSVQDGALQIIDRGGALDAKPYILDSTSGLIGSPNVDQKGIVSATALCLPDVRPGLRVIFASRFVKGVYRIEEVQHTGDSRGGSTPWFTNLTCKPLAVQL